MDFRNLTEHDIVCHTDSATLARGREYFQRGQVLSCRLTGNELEGVVSGSGRNVYEQTICLNDDDRWPIDGSCSCPMEYNCKHVTAVLLAYLDRRPANTGFPAPLSYASQLWLQNLVRTISVAHAPAAPRKVPMRLVCVFVPSKRRGGLDLVLCRSRPLPGGGFASATAIGYTYGVMNDPGVRGAADRALVRTFLALRADGDHYSMVAKPRESMGAQLLDQLLDQGILLQAAARKDLKGKMQQLVRGPRCAATLAWHMDDGVQRLRWEAEGAPLGAVLPTEPPMYVYQDQMGELALPEALRGMQVEQLLDMVEQAPLLAEGQSARLAAEMQALQLDRLFPLPPVASLEMRRDIRPTPHLFLGSTPAGHGGGAAGWHDFAVLSFDYDGTPAEFDGAPTLLRLTPQGSEQIERDAKAEAMAHATLEQLGFRRSPEGVAMRGALALADAHAWMAFGREGVPALRAQGWIVALSSSFRFDMAEIEDWYAEVGSEGKGQAWFELELGIVVEGERVPLLPILLQLIRSAPHAFDPQALAARAETELLVVRLPAGKTVGLPWSRVRPIFSTLGELYFLERVGNAIRLPSVDAARLAQLEASARLRWMGGEHLRALGQRLAGFTGVQAVAPPAGLQARLRGYQLEGLAWMQFLREYGLAGILADDMGLGKTIQTLAHILTEKEAGRLDRPALVVAPTSLMGNWQEEAARFAPDLRVLLLHGPERAARFGDMAGHDLVLTTYALLPRDEEALRLQPFHLLILDESQYIKNHRSRAAETATLLQARHRLCLTGTPLQNHLGELWSQFQFLLPGLLGDEKQFNSQFRKPIERDGDSERNAFLTRRIKPFLLRRTKDLVAKELPAKTEMLREVTLAGAQRDLYETVRLAMDKKVRAAIASKGVARSQIVILEALLKLRQVCCDPRLVPARGRARMAAPSAKLTELTGMLEELLDEGRKVLVFSQFTSMLALIEDELRERGIAYALLTGETVDRSAQVKAFQSGKVAVFLISLKAGGVGLNLTAADTVIHYDPWWNPAVESQATDRAWRIGQDKPVFVYKLIAKDTLEEKIHEMQRRKAVLASAILSGEEAHSLQLTEDDLRAILAPLQRGAPGVA
ncbi:DEAD/DEAH box helicase [Massilia sp. PAMC28688]|uniref:DEAD/DEAH box helicase n=1 Tax=Massilia sp. PAMC28688 TaxID=2861283 RepID=UPI001C62ECF2|nr:DEAD/DEAH box helicase [Massilia sp. PAMC28688]QYF94647.1 DEAD/DEAH box helicase [Massilia sp. PAMC28688]